MSAHLEHLLQAYWRDRGEDDRETGENARVLGSHDAMHLLVLERHVLRRDFVYRVHDVALDRILAREFPAFRYGDHVNLTELYGPREDGERHVTTTCCLSCHVYIVCVPRGV